LRDALDAEVLLDGRLVAAEHSGPVESATDDDTPEAVSHRGTRIHVEKFHPSGSHVVLPDLCHSTRPGQPVAQNEEQGSDQNSGLEGIGHYYGFHATLKATRTRRCEEEHLIHRI